MHMHKLNITEGMILIIKSIKRHTAMHSKFLKEWKILPECSLKQDTKEGCLQ